MFGQNAVAHVRTQADSFDVHEVFYTIQGEGPHVGQPAVFLRLAGCNLRCYFCDTDFSSVHREVMLDDLVQEILDIKGKAQVVVITGGEPMLQQLGPLCFEINRTIGLPVQIETAGTVWPSSFNDPVIMTMLLDGNIMLVCSPKTPKVHARIEDLCSNWKYIVGPTYEVDELDGLPIANTQKEGLVTRLYRPDMTFPGQTIWLQPQDCYDVTLTYDAAAAASKVSASRRNEEQSKAAVARAVELCMRYGYRMSLQTHKLLGLP